MKVVTNNSDHDVEFRGRVLRPGQTIRVSNGVKVPPSLLSNSVAGKPRGAEVQSEPEPALESAPASGSEPSRRRRKRVRREEEETEPEPVEAPADADGEA